jgi:RimJ/RimL family protein N-acetyltransferase
MLHGEKVLLRARADADVPVLHVGMYEDVVTRSRSDEGPWKPVSLDSGESPFRIKPRPDAAVFSVVETAGDQLVGSALLWGIDFHNRLAHIGMGLLPDFRGRGLGTDVVAVLCRYAFVTLGLRRVQLETLVDNVAMTKAAVRNGFQHEGTLRSNAWEDGQFLDEVIYGRLVTD